MEYLFKNVIIVGSTNLCTDCISYLIKNNNRILGVVALDSIVKDYCIKEGISLLDSLKDIFLYKKHFYLFSIVNNIIIQKDVLDYSYLIKAINYHDSPLPAYAGINSTTIAILNEESNHGVTWHEIDVGIDTGKIISQQKILIEDKDTSFSLNLKCVELAVKLFKDLIQDLNHGKLPSITQTAANKSYFGLDYIPDNYAILNKKADFDKYLRALSFGKYYVNPVATPKIYSNDKFYIVEKLEGHRFIVKDIYGVLSTELTAPKIDDISLDDLTLTQIKKYKKQEAYIYKKLNNISREIDSHKNIINCTNILNTIFMEKQEFSCSELIKLITIFLKKNFDDIVQKIICYEKEFNKLLLTRSFIDIADLLIESPIKVIKDQVEKQLRCQFVTSKDFDYRYNIDLFGEIGVYKETPEKDLHQVILIITNNQIEIRYSNEYVYVARSLHAFIINHLNKKLKIDDAKSIREHILLTDRECWQIVHYWNQNDRQYQVNETIIKLFMGRVENNPSSIAVIDNEGEYSYRTISEYTNAISLYLYDNGLCKSGRLIGVLSEKGYKQVVATLGIMQSGSAYLPLHVDWPRGRCDEVLSEGNVDTILLSSSEFNGCIKGSDIESKYNWLIIEDIINYKSNTKLEELSKPNLGDIAYVIFTSGSTGKPKGVTISHRGAVNTILAINERFNVNKQDKVLALSELSFDLSVYDMFGLLAAGGTIVFPDQKKTKEPNHWYELIDQHNITIWDTVPQLMSLLIDYVKDISNQLPSLKVTLMSGDWIPLNLPSQIKEVCPNITVMSLGGATEGSIWSIWYEIKDIDQSWKSIPYGQAMPNQKMFVLNEQGQHNPIGVIGEIHIGGDGVALGYWQDQKKTEASFIDHPQLGRLYKTGDLGKWDRNGYIVFEGRKDGQVKLNGYRVELDEISSKLAKLPGVENALVTIQDNQLVGYLVSDKEQDGYKITEYLRNYLPVYMIPNNYITIDSLPLTANGKIDYKRLPKAELINQNSYIPPRNELESEICTIWEEVLGVERVGITDDFFKIGGNSVLAIKLLYKLPKNQNSPISLVDIFNFSTIYQFCNFLNHKGKKIIKQYKIEYNNNLPNLLMIHPAGAGAEVYKMIASKLGKRFNCIGIDSYNKDSSNKITSLSKLSQLYVNMYLKEYGSMKSGALYLLGWSFGGQIALEMASILESHIDSLNVFVLDSILPDDKIIYLTKKLDFKKLRKLYKNYMLNKKYELKYIEQMSSILEIERSMSIEKPTILKKTKVYLLKATLSNPHLIIEDSILKATRDYTTSLLKNNIDKITKNLYIKNLECDHESLIDQENLICEAIDEWMQEMSAISIEP